MKYIVCAVLILLTASVHAKSSNIIFVGANFPGILQQDEQGHISGLAPDIIQQIMTPLNLPYTILVVPWKRAQSMMQNMQADVIIGPYKTPAREEQYHYSERPFYMDNMVLYTHKTNSFSWKGDLNALQNKTLAVPLGWTGGTLYEEHKHEIRVYNVPGLKNGLEMVVKRRLEFVLANLRNAQYVIETEGFEDKLQLLQPSIQKNYGYFGFSTSKTHQEFKRYFSQALTKIYDTGELTEMNQSYGFQFEKSF